MSPLDSFYDRSSGGPASAQDPLRQLGNTGNQSIDFRLVGVAGNSSTRNAVLSLPQALDDAQCVEIAVRDEDRMVRQMTGNGLGWNAIERKPDGRGP